MEWATGSRWRKAMVISLIFHGIILTGVGWLAVRALIAVEVPETVIVLELVSEPEGAPMPAAPAAALVKTSQPVTAPVPTPLIRQVQPEAILSDEIIPEPAVVVSSMAVVSVDNGVASGGGQAAAGGGGTGQAGTGTGAGAGGTGKTQGIIPPSILSKREPSYPEKARRDGLEGTVVLRIEIKENGRAGNISIQQSSGYELLDDAATDSVQRWRFVPAKVRDTGQAVVCSTTLPIAFKLKS